MYGSSPRPKSSTRPACLAHSLPAHTPTCTSSDERASLGHRPGACGASLLPHDRTRTGPALMRMLTSTQSRQPGESRTRTCNCALALLCAEPCLARRRREARGAEGGQAGAALGGARASCTAHRCRPVPDTIAYVRGRQTAPDNGRRGRQRQNTGRVIAADTRMDTHMDTWTQTAQEKAGAERHRGTHIPQQPIATSDQHRYDERSLKQHDGVLVGQRQPARQRANIGYPPVRQSETPACSSTTPRPATPLHHHTL